MSGKINEELSRFKPICSYQDEFDEDGKNDFIISFKIQENYSDTTEESYDDRLKHPKSVSPFDEQKQ